MTEEQDEPEFVWRMTDEGLDELSKTIAAMNQRTFEEQKIITILCSVTDFYPGDAEDCAHALYEAGLRFESAPTA